MSNKKCPYCGAGQEHPTKIETRYKQPYECPTTYTCGTVTSPNWAPPVRGKNCSDAPRGEVQRG